MIEHLVLIFSKEKQIILVPFIPHYVDLQVIIPWFNSLPQEQQKKVYFSPQPLPKNQRTKRRLKPIKRDETGRDIYFRRFWPKFFSLFFCFLARNTCILLRLAWIFSLLSVSFFHNCLIHLQNMFII
ncbi:MAG: hypothetical protein MRECE_1c117 [Mycoplasmataceae bacterium CE_OT135]|nr:MAG: hypothetical protein MRECE_1c050 [Mycoplasmataceae bacterium CE_OT135]KLL04351.1 MAG: hypothetical protein MRECE_1c117 [Mycoplasmataceae bacterium CE_OT135]